MNKVKIFSSMVLMVLLFLTTIAAQAENADTTTSPAPGLTSPDTTSQSADTLSQKSVDDLRKDLIDVNRQYSALRKEALKDITIGELSDKWNKKLDSVMLEKDSTTKAKFAERDQIAKDFEKARIEKNEEEKLKQQLAYKDVMLEIQKIQQKVLEDDSLRTEYQSVEDAIMNKMVELNPQAPVLKQKIEEISVAIRSKQDSKQ